VRRAKNKGLPAEDDHQLKGPRPLWLFIKANLSPSQRPKLAAIHHDGLKTGVASTAKEEFCWL